MSQENNELTKVKCKPGQGKFNRLIIKAQKLLTQLGYPERNFKRNYLDGTAVYTCPDTGLECQVNINNKQITGDALRQPYVSGFGVQR